MSSTHDGLWKYHLSMATKKSLLTEYYHHKQIIETIEGLTASINGSTQEKLMAMHSRFKDDLESILKEMQERGLDVDSL